MTTLLAAVLGSALLAVVGFLVVRRTVPALSHDTHNELVRIASAVTSSLYGLLLAFIVVTAFQGYSEARTQTEDEISALSNVMRGAGGLPRDLRQAVRADVLLYTQRVVDREWGTLAEGRFDPLSRQTYERVWSRLYQAGAMGEPQSTFFSSVLDRMNDLGRARRLRIYSSQAAVPTLLWGLILGGGLLTIGLLYLYGGGSTAIQATVIAIVAGFIGAVLFLIWALDEPFSGTLRISTEPFTYFIEQWRGRPL